MSGVSGIGDPAQRHVEGAPSMAPELFLKKQPMEAHHVTEGTQHQEHAMLTIAQVGNYYAQNESGHHVFSIQFNYAAI